jgi:hypothetical protein
MLYYYCFHGNAATRFWHLWDHIWDWVFRVLDSSILLWRQFSDSCTNIYRPCIDASHVSPKWMVSLTPQIWRKIHHSLLMDLTLCVAQAKPALRPPCARYISLFVSMGHISTPHHTGGRGGGGGSRGKRNRPTLQAPLWPVINIYTSFTTTHCTQWGKRERNGITHLIDRLE